MATTSSRFAVLKIDDELDDDKPKKSVKKKLNKQGNVNKNSQNQHNNVKSENSKKKSKSKKKPVVIDNNFSQSPINNIHETENSFNQGDFLIDNFEEDLKQALLLSKMENEKIQKSSKMNLVKSKPNGPDFEGTDSLTIKRPLQDDFKSHPGNHFDIQPAPVTHFRNVFEEDKVLSLQIEEKLLNKDREIVELKDEILKLSQELIAIKKRNKKLCTILGNAEIKEKAEVLVELDKVIQLKDELTLQVTELHSQLEQERSKVHHLSLELKRAMGHKKRTISGSDSGMGL